MLCTTNRAQRRHVKTRSTGAPWLLGSLLLCSLAGGILLGIYFPVSGKTSVSYGPPPMRELRWQQGLSPAKKPQQITRSGSANLSGGSGGTTLHDSHVRMFREQ